MSNDELDIQHRVLIEEEDIDISELPKEIQSAMRNFNRKLEIFEQNDDAELFLELQQDDIAIADDIQTFIEDDESDEDDEDDSYVDEQEGNQQTLQISSFEQQVRENIKNNLISVEQLQVILKREPDYPTEQIGKLRLRKLYLKPFYQVVNE